MVPVSRWLSSTRGSRLVSVLKQTFCVKIWIWASLATPRGHSLMATLQWSCSAVTPCRQALCSRFTRVPTQPATFIHRTSWSLEPFMHVTPAMGSRSGFCILAFHVLVLTSSILWGLNPSYTIFTFRGIFKQVTLTSLSLSFSNPDIQLLQRLNERFFKAITIVPYT